MSYFKAAGLMLLIHLAFAGLGWWIAGREGALFATVVALAFHLAVFWYAEKIMLKLHNAREVSSDDASPMIRAFVADCDRLAMRANMPRPRTYIIDAFQPNAFVAGRDTNHASIAVTDGLLKTLSRAEVSAGSISACTCHAVSSTVVPSGRRADSARPWKPKVLVSLPPSLLISSVMCPFGFPANAFHVMILSSSIPRWRGRKATTSFHGSAELQPATIGLPMFLGIFSAW